jgi:predicted SAM-dependent methyltransferase
VTDQVKLNLGCGTDIRPGFINIDIQEFPGVTKICDAIALSEFENDSVDFIVAQHLLEYIPRKHILSALAEWFRVLKKNAPLEIRITDLANVTRSLYLNGISDEMGLHHEMVVSLLYGKQRDQYDVRYNGFTPDFIQGVLVGVGYTINNVVLESYDVIITVVKQ